MLYRKDAAKGSGGKGTHFVGGAGFSRMEGKGKPRSPVGSTSEQTISWEGRNMFIDDAYLRDPQVEQSFCRNLSQDATSRTWDEVEVMSDGTTRVTTISEV